MEINEEGQHCVTVLTAEESRKRALHILENPENYTPPEILLAEAALAEEAE